MSASQVMSIQYFPEITGQRLAVMRDQNVIFVAKNNLIFVISVLDHHLHIHHKFKAYQDETNECALRILKTNHELFCLTKKATYIWDIANPTQPTFKYQAVLGGGQCVCTSDQRFQLKNKHDNITVIGQDRSCLIPKPGKYLWLYASSTTLFVADITKPAVYIYQAPLDRDKKTLPLVIPEGGNLHGLAATDKTLIVSGQHLTHVYALSENEATLLHAKKMKNSEIIRAISEDKFAIYTLSYALSDIRIYDAKFLLPIKTLTVDVGKVIDLTLLNNGHLYVLGSKQSALVDIL